MDSKRFDRLTAALSDYASRRQALKRIAGGAAGVSLGMLAFAGRCDGASAAGCSNPCNCTWCNCVYYVRCKTGLSGGPGTAAGYTESVMNGKGYVRVSPRAGAIMVWDANRKGAGPYGHMAIVNSASYNNSTKKWVITVTHTDWAGHCEPTTTRFTGASSQADWGNLYGVNFYVRR